MRAEATSLGMGMAVTNIVADDGVLDTAQIVQLVNEASALLGRDESSTLRTTRRVYASRCLDRVRAEMVQMYGYAVISEEGGVLRWETSRPRPPTPSRVRRGPKSSTSTLPLGEVLTLVATENPKRSDSRAWHTYELYRSLPDGATGETFIGLMIAHGHSRRLALSTLHWDLERGYVRLGGEEDGKV